METAATNLAPPSGSTVSEGNKNRFLNEINDAVVSREVEGN
jgi:hypothetical protein